MNEEIKQILESLQFLVSLQTPKAERNKDKQAEIMAKNHLLLHPIKDKPFQEVF